MKPVWKVPLSYAGLASFLGLLLTIVLFYSGKHPLLIPIVVDYRLIILPLFIFFAIKEYRDSYRGGAINFAQGMFVGLVVYAGMGVMLGLSIFLFDLIVGGEFLQGYVEASYQQLVDNRQQFLDAIGEEAYLSSLESTPLTTILDLASDYLIKTCALGILFTIIISVILRKEPN